MSWRVTATSWIFLLLATGTFAQQKIDCSKASSVGCTSFNELLAAKDDDIVGAITGNGKAARVCFVDFEDTFIILSFQLPLESLWQKDKGGYAYHNGPGFASLKHYKDGVSDNSFYMELTWHKFGEDGDAEGIGKGVLGRDANLAISSDETNFTSKWLNKMDTTTTYELSIRLATGRFKETYTWKDDKRNLQMTSNTGHCVRYENGVAE